MDEKDKDVPITVENMSNALGKIWDLMKKTNQNFVLSSKFSSIFLESFLQTVSETAAVALNQVFSKPTKQSIHDFYEKFRLYLLQRDEDIITAQVVTSMLEVIKSSTTSVDTKTEFLCYLFFGLLSIFILKLFRK